MTEPAGISVIIPAFRNAATIGRALASVAVQTLAPRQVIVVDDGSDDGTFAAAEACRPLFGAATRLIVSRQDNAGAGAARNAAIARAEGDWLAFLDADDEWLPGKLAASLSHLEGTDLLFASHDMEVVSPGGSSVVLDCARHFRAAADPFAALFLRGFVATSTVVARRGAVAAAGGFEISLRAAQDYDLWLHLASKGGFTVFAGALTRYHSNPQGITANAERRRRCSLAVLERNRAALEGRTARPWRVVAKRLAVIHYEAATALLGQGRPWAALWAASKLLPEIFATFPRMAVVTAWIWVVGVFLGYLAQFDSVFARILSLAGR